MSRRIKRRNVKKSGNQVERRKAEQILRSHGMAPEQFRLRRQLRANRLDREPREGMAGPGIEEKAEWENWKSRHGGQGGGFANISFVKKERRPEQRR